MNDKRARTEDKVLESLWSEIDGHYVTANKLRLQATKHSVKVPLAAGERPKEFLSERRMGEMDQPIHAELLNMLH